MDWTNAFTSTDVTRLYLDPDKKFWIEARNELSHDESRGIALASVKGVSRTTGEDKDKLVEINLGAGADQKFLTYLVDWNLIDKNGKTIDISNDVLKRNAVKNLTDEHYKAIEEVIDAHVLERASKKPKPGTPESGQTSP